MGDLVPTSNSGDSLPPPRISGGDNSRIPSSSSHVQPDPSLPSSPPRSVKPRKVLTYDENFQQVSTLHKTNELRMLYRYKSCHRIFSHHPSYELGIDVVDSLAGLRVVKVFPGLLADHHKICQPGDLLTQINNVPVLNRLSYISSLPHLGPVFTLEFLHQ